MNLVRASFALAAMLAPATCLAQRAPRERFPRPTLAWTLAQLVPSPEALIARDGVWFGLRWQITPLLFAFGLRAGVNPWRAFVVEPLARYGGSVELFASPEWLFVPGDVAQQWGLRSGVRAWFPLVERGENLAVSVGASHFLFRGEHGVGVDVGASVLFGLLGAQVTFTPDLLGAPAWIVTLRLRYL